MKKKEITQGSIVTNIRSLKYPNFPCFGIVINARCDFAQDKIQNFYLLSALPIKQWINDVLVDEILANDVINKRNKLLDTAKQNHVDIESFLEITADEFREKLKKINELEPKVIDKLVNEFNNWKKAETLLEKPQYEKKGAINSERLFTKLKPLFNGSVSNRCFIPQIGYSGNSINAIVSHIREAVSMSSDNSKIPYKMIEELRSLSVQLDNMAPEESEESNLTDGLVIDLFDILALSMELKSPIEKGEYTRETMPDKFQHLFFFDSDEQQVHVKSIVSSPYVEYIMQHFSNAFVRIGVENASETQIQQFCKAIVNEWKGATT